MCGIVGVVNAGDRRRYGRADVLRMADTIVHRGPDDHGVYDGGEAVLGMRRLSIIDLEGGHQPISNEDGSVWVVCNGEIYNFQRLRRRLQERGHRFRTHSDVEVLVHLYEEHGERLVEHLEGMFGFALWDARAKKLLLGRDRLGIKPVYYTEHSSGGIAFSSEIKAFLALPGFQPAVDAEALCDHLAIGYAVAPRTIFSGVLKLPPAMLACWHDGRLTMTRYWSAPQRVDDTREAADWVEQTRAALEDAVADHMVADVPVGAFLSGGIDSSAVAVLMARHSREALNTYSIGYAGDAAGRHYNELSYASLVAKQLDSNHRQIIVRPDVARLLPKLIWHLEEPISDSAITTTYLVSELAAKSVKVILSGVGGDELFAGYNRYLGQHYEQRYGLLPAWARLRILPRLVNLLPSGRQNRLMDLSRYAKRFVSASGLGWRQRYKLYLALADEDTLARLSRLRPASSDDGLDAVLARESADDDLLRLMRVDLETQLPEDLLLLTDKMTMACSLECRVPFLDHRLVELAASIPARHKLPNGRLKAVLKEAVRGLLPDTIIDRRKRGFGAPVGAWLKRELAPLRRSLLSREAVTARGLFDPSAVERVCRDHDASREDYSDFLLVLLNVEIWSRLFLDGVSHEDVSMELAERSAAA